MQEQDMKSLLEAEEESMQEVREHDVVKATVVAVDDGQAYVNIAGLKADIPISKRELASPEPDSAKDVVKVDDEIEVFVVSLGGENGATVSKVRADRMVAWKEIEALKEEGKTVQAQVTQVVKGGLVASVSGLRGFIPASQMELHFVKDLSIYVGQTVEALPIEIDIRKRIIPQEQFEEALLDGMPRPTHSMRRALAESPTGIIAEFKRRSPSKGWIAREADPADVVPDYARAGAAALSVLTDEKFFGGTVRDLRAVRPLTDLPILRKDFIIDAYQLYEARIIGADAVLLIAAALSPDQCRELADVAHRLGLEVLLELHTADELRHICPEVDMIGINNRHLGSFSTDPEHSLRMAGLLPAGDDVVRISESGLSDPATIHRLRRAGYRGFLIGETFMRASRPGEALADFLRDVEAQGTEATA